MARKRVIDPDFFSDGELVEHLDFAGRLLYIGLWTVAEDSAVFVPNAASLRMKIFPGDPVSSEQIDRYLDILVDKQKIIYFQASDGRTYAWLTNFHRHQKLDNPPAPKLPLPSWVRYVPGDTRKKCRYVVDWDAIPGRVRDVSGTCPGQEGDVSGTCPAEVKGKEEKGKEKAADANARARESTAASSSSPSPEPPGAVPEAAADADSADVGAVPADEPQQPTTGAVLVGESQIPPGAVLGGEPPVPSGWDQIERVFFHVTGTVMSYARDGPDLKTALQIATPEQVVAAIHQGAERYRPRHEGDRIRTFGYFLPIVREIVAEEAARREVAAGAGAERASGRRRKGGPPGRRAPPGGGRDERDDLILR